MARVSQPHSTHAQFLIRNCSDRSYVTSELFVPHRALERIARSDSTAVLMNSREFDLMPIEDELKKLEIVEEAIVFGPNNEYPGVLLFPSCTHTLCPSQCR